MTQHIYRIFLIWIFFIPDLHVSVLFALLTSIALCTQGPGAKGWTHWTMELNQYWSSLFSCLVLSFFVCQSELFTLQMPSDTPNMSTKLNTLIQEHLLWFTCRTGELRTSGPGSVSQEGKQGGWRGGWEHQNQPPLNWKVLEWLAKQRLEVTPTAHMKCICSHYSGLSAAANTRGLTLAICECYCIMSLNLVT